MDTDCLNGNNYTCSRELILIQIVSTAVSNETLLFHEMDSSKCIGHRDFQRENAETRNMGKTTPLARVESQVKRIDRSKGAKRGGEEHSIRWQIGGRSNSIRTYEFELTRDEPRIVSPGWSGARKDARSAWKNEGPVSKFRGFLVTYLTNKHEHFESKLAQGRGQCQLRDNNPSGQAGCVVQSVRSCL